MSLKFSFFLLVCTLHLVFADLQIGFYNKTCPNAESIIRGVVQERFRVDKSVTAALLRMHFHDCFVRGCDASILIDSTSNNPSEKEAGPNQTVRDFDLIDEAKARLEAACPSTVSCADIIALATRDAVALVGGPAYSLPTGRRDGLVSNVNDVDVPDPTFSVSQALQAFQAKGFTLTEMVVLLGGHSVGVAHCSFFQDRISDFQGSGAPDPTMNKTLVSKLQKICGSATNSNPDPAAFLDQNTPFLLDNQFYVDVLTRNGILQIDQELASDKSAVQIVSTLAKDGIGFRKSFANAMVKMGSVQVLIGNAGEIRKNCRVFNPKTSPPRQSPPPPPPRVFSPKPSPQQSPPPRVFTPKPSPQQSPPPLNPSKKKGDKQSSKKVMKDKKKKSNKHDQKRH